VFGGFVGFLVTENLWDEPFDALYLTIITFTTVGFGDIVPVTAGGRVIAIAVAIGGIAAVISTLQVVFNLAVSNRLREELGLAERRSKMKGHFIICGYGNVGREIANRLEEQNERFVIVEKDQDKIQSLVEEGMEVIKGDAEDEDVLGKAGIMEAKGLIAAMKDSSNLVTVLTARTMNPDLFIISEVEEDRNEPRLRRVGANATINCYRIGARIMVGRARRKESDPVCGVEVDGKKGISLEYEGNTYHFCSPECQAAFKAHPDRFKEWQKAFKDYC